MSVSSGTGAAQEPIFEAQSGRVALTVPCKAKRKVDWTRGEIKGRSENSRKRQMRLFASVDWKVLIMKESPLWWVTVTTRAAYWHEHEFCGQALERLFDYMEYAYGNTWEFAFWAKELGPKHGMLHYHLIVVGPSLLNPADLLAWWRDAMRDESINEVHVEAVDSPSRVQKYLGKYCAKAAYHGKGKDCEDYGVPLGVGAPEGDAESVSEAPLTKYHILEKKENTGRWWGVRGRKNLPMGVIQTFEGAFAMELGKRMRRFLRRWLKSKGINYWKKLLGWYRDKHGNIVRYSGFTFLGSPEMLYPRFDPGGKIRLQGLVNWVSEQVFFDIYEACPF